jgi:hypothetical protein
VSIAALLKGSADTFMTVRLVKRVADDVVHKIPYPAMGAAVLLGAILGATFTHRRQTTGRAATRRPQGRLPKTAA